MTPYYLTPDFNRPLDLQSELLFHKRNIYLLALTFDHVLICTDNIAAFTRFASADVVSKVIAEDWFQKLSNAGVIVLCGWGSDHGLDLMENQIDYSMRYRPELKSPQLLAGLRGLARHSEIIVRESAFGERDHVLFLRNKVRYLEGQYTLDEVAMVSDLVEETQTMHGFVGTMEIFPIIDDFFLADPKKADGFYKAYFQSWQEYCSAYYAPAVTVDSFRIRLPGRKTGFLKAASEPVISTLYSPDFFGSFLKARLGAKLAVKLLDAKAERIIGIRNGDWKVFVNRYHDCLASASQVAWIVSEAGSLNLLLDEKRVTEILDYIFDVLDPNTDLASIGNLLDIVLKMTIGASFLGPIFSMFRTKINSRLLRVVNKAKNREFEPFFRKLETLLLQRLPQTQLATP